MQRERGVLIQLYDDETLVAVLRKHWFGMLNNILLVSFLLLFFIIGIYFAYGAIATNTVRSTIGQCSIGNSITNNLGQGALIVFGSAYLLSVIGYAFIAWLDYYLDLFIITNKRILRVEQLVLFNQRVSETSFQHVQDVSSQVKGFINTLLNIGTVYIETAGERENFSFTYIKDPSAVAATILELQKTMWDAEGIKTDLGNERKHEKIEKMNQTAQENYNSDDANHPVNNPNEQDDLHNISEENMRYFHEEFVPEELKKDKSDIAIQKSISDKIENKLNSPYRDGRMITSYGVIWQSEQELTSDILETLNNMEKGEDVTSEW